MTVLQNLQIRQSQAETALVEAGLIAGGTAVTTPTSYDYLGKGADEGSVFGYTTTDKISFWGVDPVNQPDSITATLTSITLTATAADVYSEAIGLLVTGDSTCFGFGSWNEGSTVLHCIHNLHIRMNEIETNLTEVGILATSTAGISVTTSLKLNFLDKGNDDGTVVIATATNKLGFWGTAPADQPAALTTMLTTITCTLTATPDYAIAALVSASTAYKFANFSDGVSFLLAVKNLQTRMDEMEDRLEEIGLIAAN